MLENRVEVTLGLFSDCKQMVKYSGTSIEIATVKGPLQVPVSIGGVAIKPQLLQTAGAILQILDWLQFTGCQRIHELKKLKDIPQKIVADLILRQDEDARMIANVAIISMTVCVSPKNFEKVLADWIAAALPRAREKRKGTEYPVTVSSLDYLREKTEKSQGTLKRLESQIRELEEAIRGLTAQLREMKSRRRQLEQEKTKLQLLLKDSFMRMRFLDMRILTERGVEERLSKAISVFPYLSQAISKNKPFDIEKSVKALMGNR